MLLRDHDYWMALAFREAEKAYREEEVPVGAVVVFENQVIGKGYNQTEKLQDPTAHAEILAITAAASHLNSRRLLETKLYVTLEPCAMCAGACVLARIPLIVFGTDDPKAGACGSVLNVISNEALNHRAEVISGVKQYECSAILSDFFKKIRSKN